MSKNFLLFLLIGFCYALSAQTTDEVPFTGCATDQMSEKHPEFYEAQKRNDQAAYEAARQGADAQRSVHALRTLPVVVHIIHNGGAENISDARIQQGIAQLNAAFNATFGTGVNTDLQFCLAQRDPQGLATTGITRNQSPLTVFNMDKEDLAVKNINRWNPSCYINIWVVAAINSTSSGNGVVGYAYLPSAHGSAVDGIVMEAAYLGSSQANTGVLVHEIGHYLGLYHTFQGGCGNGDCLLQGDRVCDTPPDQTTFSSCNPNANSCNTDADDLSSNNPFTSDVPDLGEDYMDYSTLSCFSKFTKGQSERMNWHVTQVRSSLLSCLSCAPPCPAPITAAITLPANPPTITIGSSLIFSATASNSNSYAWNVGTDPAFSNALTGSYTFNMAGFFWVKFRAVSSDPTRCPEVVDSVKVIVECNAQAVFSVPPVILNGSVVTFTNTSANASSYEWILDNMPVATSTDFTYTFANTGAYQLCLRAKNAQCTDILCTTIYVQASGSPTEGCDNTFIQSLSNLGGTRPNIFPHPNGDFFATGLRNDSTVIVRFDQGGTALWARAFRFGADVLQIRDMFVDASGDLIGVAHPEVANSSQSRSMAFRFNLTSNTFVWVRNFSTVLYSQIHALDAANCVLTGTSNSSRTQLIKIDKGTGAVNGYNLEGEQGDFLSTIHNGTLYGACRRYHNSSGDFRVAVFAHNQATGAFQWQNSIISRGNTSISTMTRMYPEKPIVDGEHLVVAASGDLVGFDTYLLGDVELVLAKTTLLGDVLWTKRYDLPGYSRPVATAVVSTATGYYLVASLYSPVLNNFNYGLIIKTDKQGQVQWAKRLGISGKNIVRNVMERNGYLYLTLSSDSYTPNGLLLVKLDQQGNTNSACDFVKVITVNAVTLPNIQDQRNYMLANIGPTPISQNVVSKATSLATETYCKTPCACLPLDLSVGADTTVCQGALVVLQATPGFDSYEWTPTTGLNNPKIANPVATPSTTTTYTLNALNLGPDLVKNGDFSQGNTGFVTNYLSPGTGFGHYYVTNNPLQFNGLWNIPNDHSPSSDGLMLLLDGSITGTYPVMWQQSVTVEPNKNYRFELWGAIAYFTNPPSIQVKINGIVQTVFQLKGGNAFVGIWQPFTFDLYSGNATQLNIELTDLVIASSGNDFALDDIRLLSLCPYTDSITIHVRNSTGQILDLGPDVSACVNAVHTFDAGAGFATYLWQDGSTDRTFTAFLPGTYWVAVQDSCGSIQHDTVMVQLIPSPSLDLGADRAICTGGSAQLSFSSNGSFATYNWSPANGLSCTTCPNPLAQPASTTTYYLAASTADGCTNLDSVTVLVRQPTAITQTIHFCSGESVTIGGKTYTESGTVVDTLPGTLGCDTIVTYTLNRLPLLTRAQTIQFCSGESVTIGGKTYTESGTVVDTLPGTPGCDTIVTYTLNRLPLLTRAQTIHFCSGESVTIGGKTYTESGTVVDTLPGTPGCDTIVTYTLNRLPLLTRAQTIPFCPGETVIIGGQAYTQAGIVLDTIPSTSGSCDTVVSYTLQSLTPAPSVVSIQCPNAINLATLPGAGPALVSYNSPTSNSDCPCPGTSLKLTAGLPSGSVFPPGATEVCYTARDSCGHSASCCFQVMIREAQACDTKEIGCLKYELLNITADAGQNYTYRIRVTNKCANKLIYTAIEIPDGVTAIKPLDFSTFEAESGRKYTIRNPNFTPFYSIRFKSTADSLANGQSEVLKYTLPAQTDPDYILISSRLVTQEFYAAHLNTFNCPVGVTPEGNKPADRDLPVLSQPSTLRIFPNPSAGEVFVDLSTWRGQTVQVQMFNALGQQVQLISTFAEATPYSLQVPVGATEGLYHIALLTSSGERLVARFVLQR